jgi:ornithine cyclodeaminase/alanine dehydrogenase
MGTSTITDRPMPKTRILTRSDVASLLEPADVVRAVEQAFAAHGRGEARMPAKVYLDLPEHDGDFRAMPSALDGAAGVKWVNSHPKNPERHGLPSVMGIYVLSDPATAAPLAILDATWLTAVRTGAAAAVASKHLAKKGARTIGFVGCGVQAHTMLSAHRVIFPELEVLGADASRDAAKRFADEVGGRVVSLAEASSADIVCTSTPVRTPVVERAWVRDGAHVNAMGADGPGKQELDARILLDARVIIDDWEQATHSGEVNVPLHDGVMQREHIAGTLGEVAAGRLPGRTSEAQITLFDSTGLAVQDLAVARLVHAAAVARGIGVELDLVG